jgi:hypothetical protein
MRPDIAPGSDFPDYELSDHTGKQVKDLAKVLAGL